MKSPGSLYSLEAQIASPLNSTTHFKNNSSQTLPKKEGRRRGGTTSQLILRGQHYPDKLIAIKKTADKDSHEHSCKTL